MFFFGEMPWQYIELWNAKRPKHPGYQALRGNTVGGMQNSAFAITIGHSKPKERIAYSTLGYYECSRHSIRKVTTTGKLHEGSDICHIHLPQPV